MPSCSEKRQDQAPPAMITAPAEIRSPPLRTPVGPAAFEKEAVGGPGTALEPAAHPGLEQGAREEPAVDAGRVRVVQRPRRCGEGREHLLCFFAAYGANRMPAVRARKDQLRGGLELGELVVGDRGQQQPAAGEPGAGPFRLELGDQCRKVAVRRAAEAVPGVGVAAVGRRRNDPGPGRGGAPLVFAVEQQHPGPGSGQVKGGGSAEDAAPDDDEVVHFSPRC